MFIFLPFTVAYNIVFTQPVFEIGGALVLQSSESNAPELGTIRFNIATKEFEGWNGVIWISLSGYATISTREWMAENLRSTRYNDSSPIPYITADSIWSEIATGAWSWYNNDPSFEKRHGKLYSWYTVSTHKLCPLGRRVPSQSDWDQLNEHLGGSLVTGGHLKEKGLTYWNSPNLGASNRSGFSSRASGIRSVSGRFAGLGSTSSFWSTEGSGQALGSFLALYSDLALFQWGGTRKQEGLSVRCFRD